uniref:Uncharacterized protein n=1 Tax=Avena sativa TaxID=4498 RepID=A0ACD6A256_AVESA
MQACLLLYVTLCDHCEIKMNGDSSSSKVRKLPLQYLKQITNNFSDKLVLGTGGFGVVYKGVQPNGRIVAVKKLLHSKPSSLEQFENEVDLLMRLEHPNIVRLVGYCYEIQNEHVPYNGKYVFAGETESLLCLEYLPNGSLDRFLSDPDEFSRFDWHTCYQIIEGTCNGLQYLHEQTNGPIIHLDLKPANILLGDVLVPKITDFGLSRLLDREQTICTMMVTGTLGYMPPEYLQGILTPMSDIFSLGVIILEIVTGERKYPDDISTSSEEFVELELKKWRNALQKKPGYTSLEIDCHQVKRCIQIGLACMNPLRAKRPTITQIIKMLQALEGTDCNISNEVISPAAQVRSLKQLVNSKLLLLQHFAVHQKINEFSHQLRKYTNMC